MKEENPDWGLAKPRAETKRLCKNEEVSVHSGRPIG